MANGIGRVWAANAGDDEQRPNGVGSVWIENIDALAPSGGASEEQINELSAAIDYVSANAGDPNALTGYQDGGEISADGNFFEAKRPGGYDLKVGYDGKLSAINACSAEFSNACSAVFTQAAKAVFKNNGLVSADGSYGFVVSGQYHDLTVDAAGHLSAKNNASAVFTNGSLVSADSENGFVFSSRSYPVHISAAPYGLQTKNTMYDIKADNNGFDISANNGATPLTYRNGRHNITLAGSDGFAFNVSSRQYSAWINSNGGYGFSGNGAIGSFGNWFGNSESFPVKQYNLGGVGFSGLGTDFGVYNGGKLNVRNMAELEVNFGGHVSANNSCSALFSNGSNTKITNGHVLFVGDNELGSMHGILVSGNGTQFISIYNGGSVKVAGGDELNLSANTRKYGMYLNASGSRFVSADGEGVSAWKPASMDVMGEYNQTSSNAAFVIGNGTHNTARSDLFVIDYSGNAKSNDFIAAPKPIVHTVTGNMTATQFGSEYYYSPVLSSELGIDLTKVAISVDFSELDTGSYLSLSYHGLGSTAEYNWYTWNDKDTFKQNFEQPFSTSSTFTGYSTIEGDPTSLTSVSAIDFVLDSNTTIPYTATWTEEVAPKSFMDLYNAFTAYTASHP